MELVDDKAGPMVARLGIPPRGDGHNATSLLFPNGSRIVGIPAVETTTRGFSAASLILIDEASRVPDAMYKSLRPMLAVSGGDLWLMSTPNGRRGFFYENWEYDRRENWFRVRVTALECPRISAEYVEDERNQHGDQWVAQEYLAEFTDNGTAVFDRDLIERALDDDIEPL